MGQLEAVLVDFARAQRARGLSVKTIRRRAVSIGRFAEYIAPTEILEATEDDVQAWLDMYPSKVTRKAYRSDLKAMYEWAIRRRLTDNNPITFTEPIRAPKGLPRPVPPALIPMIIMTATPDVRLMCALAAMAGLRCDEIANLDRADIDLTSEPKTIAVRHGKGDKDRIIPIHPDLAVLLRGLPAGPVVRVKAARVGVKIAQHLHSLGIDATAHQLRHSFGTELARIAEGNLVLVAKLMGHESTDTTMRYVGWAGGPAAEAVKGMYPKAVA